MASKKKSLADSAQAMTEGLFGSPAEKKEDKKVIGPPEGSIARSLQEVEKKEPRTMKVTVTRKASEADTAIVKKTAQNGKGKTVKATYGARISAETTIQWKAYIEASGSDAGVCTEQALREYMDRHKLTGIQKQIYDLKMQALNK